MVHHQVRYFCHLLLSCKFLSLFEDSQLSIYVVNLSRYLANKLRNINLYSNPNKAVEDEQSLRFQHVSTRIYMVLLVVAFIILSFYSSFTYVTSIKIVGISNVDDYIKLRNKYNGHSSVSKFECPCQTLSFAYSSYIHQLEPSLHEVCSSNIVSNEWLQILFESYLNLNHSWTDAFTFPGTAFGNYQALVMMCNLVKESVDLARTLFLNSISITSEILDPNQFEQNTKRDIEQFQQEMPNNFIRIFQLVRGLNQANGFVSAYSSNWRPTPIFNLTGDGSVVSYDPQYYEGCNCAISSSCYQRLDNNISGYVVGCVPVESLLQSTIQCHYNLSCIQSLYWHITGKCCIIFRFLLIYFILFFRFL